MSDSEHSDVDCPSPTDDEEVDNEAAFKSLPESSRKKYEITHKRFMDWRQENNIETISENAIMAYFGKLSQNFKSSTMWAQYSMLRNTLRRKEKIDIAQYLKLRGFLKRQSRGYEAKKAKTLTSNEIYSFLNAAPDNKYLLVKVALVIGITGACRRDELRKLKLEDVQDSGVALTIKIPDRKTKVPRQFSISGQFYQICKKYLSLRPPEITEKAFFLNYSNGRCTKQVVGVNKLGNTPKDIAKFLRLPNADLYTGHCFRRSSVNLLTDAGGSITSLISNGPIINPYRTIEIAPAIKTNLISPIKPPESAIYLKMEPSDPENVNLGSDLGIQSSTFLQTNIPEDLKCLKCGQMLTVLPIFWYLNQGNVCGRCQEVPESHCFQNKALEAFIRLQKLPCRYRKYNCFETTDYLQIKTHEENCYYRLYDCFVLPLGCRWQGLRSEMSKHFENEHKNYFMKENSCLVFNINTDFEQNIFIEAMSKQFLLHMRYNQNRWALSCGLIYFEKPADNTEYAFAIVLQSDTKEYRRKIRNSRALNKYLVKTDDWFEISVKSILSEDSKLINYHIVVSEDPKKS